MTPSVPPTQPPGLGLDLDASDEDEDDEASADDQETDAAAPAPAQQGEKSGLLAGGGSDDDDYASDVQILFSLLKMVISIAFCLLHS